MKGVGLGIKAGLGAFKAGDMKQVGGEYDPCFGFRCLFVCFVCCVVFSGPAIGLLSLFSGFILSSSVWLCFFEPLRTEANDRFLIGPGEICHWGHRMTNTRDHTEINEIRKILKLNNEIPEQTEKVTGNGIETMASASEISK